MDRMQPSQNPSSFQVGQIIRGVKWDDWVRESTDPEQQFDGIREPGENFLIHLQMMIERLNADTGSLDIVAVVEDRQLISFEFTPGSPVTLAQVMDDITYWPIGVGVVLFCRADGASCAFIRGQDGIVARYHESELVIETSIKTYLREVSAAVNAAFAHLGTLDEDFFSLHDTMQQAADNSGSGSKNPAPITNPLLVVCASPGRILDVNGVTLPTRPVSVADQFAWMELQELAQLAKWKPAGIFVVGVDGDRYRTDVWTSKEGF